MTQLSFVVAMDENRLIGSDNRLPWHMPADLALFKRTTMGKPIVMGRRTFESIGKPLPGRRNIVVSRNPEYAAEGCEVVGDIDSALALCAGDEEVMLIGGASLYRQTIERASRMYITLIHHEFSGDTWFPEFDPGDWKVAERREFAADENNPYAWSFVKYVKEF
jgi:dihydrofolate reductase